MKQAILLISHGRLAEEMRSSIEMIAGDVNHIYCCCLKKEESSNDFIEKLVACIQELSTYENVLVFADLYGGSPCNHALKYLVEDHKYQIISGMNLSMVLSSSLNEDEKVESLLNIGRNAIIDVKDVYSKMNYEDDED